MKTKFKIFTIFICILFFNLNQLKSQTIKSYHENGKIKEIGNFNGHEKHGQWISYDEYGNKIAEAYYVNDKKDGNWLIWDLNGNKRYEMFYKNGEKIGVWRMWDENGKLIQEKKF